MATGQINGVLHHFRRVALLRDGGGMTDGQLLECFVARRDEAAFEALVRRHGSMVWGVCFRALRNAQDAEDAFQATFVVLARKAASIRQRELVGNWLYGAAYRATLEAKAARRRVKERQVNKMPEPEAPAADEWHDLRPLLDQELSRLPDKYRVPVVLCDLEGRTRRQVARQLGIPEGTLSGRLTTARRMLAKRLARHGMTLSAGALAAALSQNAASASAPTALVASTVKAASSIAVGQAVAAGVMSAKVAALSEGVLKAMFVTKLQTTSTLLLVVALAASLSLSGLAQSGQAGNRLAQKLGDQANDAKPAAATKPPAPAEDLDTKWPEDTPRILELQPCLLRSKWDENGKIIEGKEGSVAKELKLSKEQIDEIHKIDLQVCDADKDKGGEVQGRALSKAMHENLPRILKPEQIKRFKQIGLQMLGPDNGGAPCVGAMSYPEIQRQLKLIDKQKEKIKEIDAQAKKEFEHEQKKVFDAGGDLTAQLHVEHSRKIHKAALEKAVELLTDEQKKAWKKMTGEPFQYKWDFED